MTIPRSLGILIATLAGAVLLYLVVASISAMQ
jgi:hypothetical protein